MQQLDHNGQAVVQAHGILGHLGVLVAGGQVTEGTDRRLCDVLPVAGTQDCTHQGLDAANLKTMHQGETLIDWDTVGQL